MPDPEVSITAGPAVTEGGDASFTLTASPAPAADLPVTVTVAGDGDYGSVTGTRTVTTPTSGSVSFTVTTSNARPARSPRGRQRRHEPRPGVHTSNQLFRWGTQHRGCMSGAETVRLALRCLQQRHLRPVELAAAAR